MNIAQKYIIQQLRRELGANEATEHLIDWLLDAWETREILRDHFGEVRALQLFTACAPIPQASVQETALVCQKKEGRNHAFLEEADTSAPCPD